MPPDPFLRIVKVDGILFSRIPIHKTKTILRQKDEGRPHAEIDACCEKLLIQEDYITVAKRVQDIDATLRCAAVQDP
jgi:hypothetical protein